MRILCLRDESNDKYYFIFMLQVGDCDVTARNITHRSEVFISTIFPYSLGLEWIEIELLLILASVVTLLRTIFPIKFFSI